MLSSYETMIEQMFLSSQRFHRNFVRDQRAKVRLPRSLEDVREVYSVLLNFVDDYFHIFLLFYIAVFLFIQSFAIPGRYVNAQFWWIDNE